VQTEADTESPSASELRADEFDREFAAEIGLSICHSVV
jgi:hypothetical protein